MCERDKWANPPDNGFADTNVKYRGREDHHFENLPYYNVLIEYNIHGGVIVTFSTTFIDHCDRLADNDSMSTQ